MIKKAINFAVWPTAAVPSVLLFFFSCNEWCVHEIECRFDFGVLLFLLLTSSVMSTVRSYSSLGKSISFFVPTLFIYFLLFYLKNIRQIHFILSF
jgi:hypothetical protein